MNRDGDSDPNRKTMLAVLLRLGLVAAVGVATTLFAYGYFNNGAQTERPYEATRPRRQRRQGGQKRKLIDELCSNTVECFCVEVVKADDPVFTCDNCFNIFHLRCIKHWASVGWGDGRQWTCPACMKVFKDHPGNLTYKCMCGQTESPVMHSGVTPHCCTRRCPRCDDSCHPGPCDTFIGTN